MPATIPSDIDVSQLPWCSESAYTIWGGTRKQRFTLSEYAADAGLIVRMPNGKVHEIPAKTAFAVITTTGGEAAELVMEHEYRGLGERYTDVGFNRLQFRGTKPMILTVRAPEADGPTWREIFAPLRRGVAGTLQSLRRSPSRRLPQLD